MPARPRVPFPVVAALALAAVFVLTASCAGRASLAPDNRLSAWPLALAAILPGVAAWRLGAVTLGGAAAGGAVATSAAAGFGAGMVVLLGFGLVLTVAATACGRRSKERRGLAEPRRGRRGAANVLANTGIFGAIGLGAAVGHPDAVGPAVAAVAALTTGVSDTVASEIGQVIGGTPRLLTTGRPVPAGTPGAVSFAGVAACATAAALLAAGASVLGAMPSTAAVPVVAAAVVASLVEGIVSRAFEVTGWIDNHTVNLVATAVGAVTALVLTGIGM